MDRVWTGFDRDTSDYIIMHLNEHSGHEILHSRHKLTFFVIVSFSNWFSYALF